MDREHRHWRTEADDVWASEVATYAFCAKAWHLEHVLHTWPTPEAVRRRARGVRHHEQHGQRIARIHTSTVRVGVLAAALVVLSIVLLIVVARSI